MHTGGPQHTDDPWGDREDDEHNFFQARYAIRHAWTGPIRCDKPVRGRWGGPPNEVYRRTFQDALNRRGNTSNLKQPIGVKLTAFAPRGKLALASVIGRDLTEISVLKAAAPTPPPPPSGTTRGPTKP